MTGSSPDPWPAGPGRSPQAALRLCRRPRQRRQAAAAQAGSSHSVTQASASPRLATSSPPPHCAGRRPPWRGGAAPCRVPPGALDLDGGLRPGPSRLGDGRRRGGGEDSSLRRDTWTPAAGGAREGAGARGLGPRAERDCESKGRRAGLELKQRRPQPVIASCLSSYPIN